MAATRKVLISTAAVLAAVIFFLLATLPATPRGIIEELNLRRPIYKKTAAFGHFGRSEPEFTWERTDKAATLRSAAGL